MKIEVLDVSSKFDLIIEEAKAVALSSADDSRLSAYHSENKELEQLDRIACNTLHDCMQKVFEDGPKRDQRLWMGDLRLQALANYETYQMNDMVKGCLYLFGAGALPYFCGVLGRRDLRHTVFILLIERKWKSLLRFLRFRRQISTGR